MWSHEICIRLRGELEGGHLYIDPVPEEDGKDSSRSDMSCNPYSPLFFTKSTNESINYSIMCFFFCFCFWKHTERQILFRLSNCDIFSL